MTTVTAFDVIIIGGSYAGLSAAMALGRSLKKTLVIDSGKPCNAQTPHSHNFLTHDGETPQAISQQARKQIAQYPHVRLLNDTVTQGHRTAAGFAITTLTGETFTASKLIFATGIKDLLPKIPGFAECWGISVIHCPYCHGYEYHNQATGILANGERAFHLAGLVHNLSTDLRILTNGKAQFTPEQYAILQRHGIPVVTSEITTIVHQQGMLQQVQLKDGHTLPLRALYAAVPFEQHSDIPASLGCTLTEQGHIQVDSFYNTTVSGIFACGDSVSPMRSVAQAVATGNMTGAMVNKALTDERFL
ncbi:FAD-dependent oxidoreductase [Olivibacter ginsenosidimutans]|uniref:FAD-dependent oxidoreductase n=1 Tax=Olivibacter ginsenosidimutans TaxID=1176537 RepID=A0ABP9BUJ1_9SPHI